MSEVKHNLGQRLRELRGNRTLQEVAEPLGIDRRSYQRYENGRIPKDGLLETIASFYEVPFDELKQLCFEDLFPEGSRDRSIIFQWVHSKKQE